MVRMWSGADSVLRVRTVEVIVDPNGPRLMWHLLDLARACFMLTDTFSQMTPFHVWAYPRLLACWLGSQITVRPFSSALSGLQDEHLPYRQIRGYQIWCSCEEQNMDMYYNGVRGGHFLNSPVSRVTALEDKSCKWSHISNKGPDNEDKWNLQRV